MGSGGDKDREKGTICLYWKVFRGGLHCKMGGEKKDDGEERHTNIGMCKNCQ